MEEGFSPYLAVLALHSAMRWVAIVAGLGAVLFAWRPNPARPRRAERWGLALMIAVDVQLLLGLLLYFVMSPVTTAAIQNVSANVRNPWVRFFMIDHVVLMLAAVILVHIGRILARKATSDQARHARMRLYFGLALIAMIIATPWPRTAVPRPLFRLWSHERD